MMKHRITCFSVSVVLIVMSYIAYSSAEFMGVEDLMDASDATNETTNIPNKNMFDENYNISWGGYHVRSYDKRRIVQLVLDKYSGSGFNSKTKYMYGNFTTRIKLVNGDSSGLVTAFYLTTQENSHHDEVDFEFLGVRSGKFYRLQTNVFVDGSGNREERMRLWFDPTAAFHSYSIVWDPKEILFLVDNVLVRVYKKLDGQVPFPSTKPMQVVASLWNGEDWATEGGKRKVNWNNSPFHVSFEGFDIEGCKSDDDPSNISSCLENPWRNIPTRTLRLTGDSTLKHIRRRHVSYTYCKDKARYQSTPTECKHNEHYP